MPLVVISLFTSFKILFLAFETPGPEESSPFQTFLVRPACVSNKTIKHLSNKTNETIEDGSFINNRQNICIIYIYVIVSAMNYQTFNFLLILIQNNNIFSLLFSGKVLFKIRLVSIRAILLLEENQKGFLFRRCVGSLLPVHKIIVSG